MPANLYFGPYNDPGDTHPTPLHHWDPDHDPDCHNPAFTIDRPNGSQTLSIILAVRNSGDVASSDDLIITLYAAACGVCGTVADVDALVHLVLGQGDPGAAKTTFLKRWSNDENNLSDGNAQGVVPALNTAIDTPWSLSVPLSWDVPAFSSSYILVATLRTYFGHQEIPGDKFTQSPCVAIWLG